MQKAYFNWSSGKDSALALYRALHSGRYLVEALLSVVKADCGRIAMHEIGEDLLGRQARAIGIPLSIVRFNPDAPESYGTAMREQMKRFAGQNITTALFGDLYFEQLRKSREQKCTEAGMQAKFPLWGIPQEEIMHEFLRHDFKAVVTCVDGSVLPGEWVGREIDEAFLQAYPPGADLCGENGEYHSFVYDGPIFEHPVAFVQKGKYYMDFLGADTGRSHRYWYLKLE